MKKLLPFAIAIQAACSPQNQSEEPQSSVYALNESGNQAIAEVTDFKSAEAYAKTNGYFDGGDCSSNVKGGEKVWYSASYDFGEAGQAFGDLQADGNKVFFNQKGMPTTQAMFAPGLGGFDGKSLWEFKRYFKTLCSVAFGKGRSGADYQSIKAEKINMTGGTAGGNVAYQDALKLSLHKSANGGKTDVIIILVKGLGPRVMEFRETSMPAGTSKVYIDGTPGGGGGNTKL